MPVCSYNAQGGFVCVTTTCRPGGLFTSEAFADSSPGAPALYKFDDRDMLSKFVRYATGSTVKVDEGDDACMYVSEGACATVVEGSGINLPGTSNGVIRQIAKIVGPAFIPFHVLSSALAFPFTITVSTVTDEDIKVSTYTTCKHVYDDIDDASIVNSPPLEFKPNKVPYTQAMKNISQLHVPYGLTATLTLTSNSNKKTQAILRGPIRVPCIAECFSKYGSDVTLSQLLVSKSSSTRVPNNTCFLPSWTQPYVETWSTCGRSSSSYARYELGSYTLNNQSNVKNQITAFNVPFGLKVTITLTDNSAIKTFTHTGPYAGCLNSSQRVQSMVVSYPDDAAIICWSKTKQRGMKMMCFITYDAPLSASKLEFIPKSFTIPSDMMVELCFEPPFSPMHLYGNTDFVPLNGDIEGVQQIGTSSLTEESIPPLITSMGVYLVPPAQTPTAPFTYA
jgi:hypothetical protein